jgi:hypothetical protein
MIACIWQCWRMLCLMSILGKWITQTNLLQVKITNSFRKAEYPKMFKKSILDEIGTGKSGKWHDLANQTHQS